MSCHAGARTVCALILTFALALPVSAADSQGTLLSGAHVHTVSGETLSPGMVLLLDGKIAEVGANLQAEGATIISLEGLHLYPGLVAATTSLGLAEIGAVRSTLDTTEVGAFTPEVESWIAVNPDSALLPVARAGGITHALTIPMGGTVSGRSGVIVLDGWTTEEMAVLAPAALDVSWPRMALDLNFAGESPRGHAGDEAEERKSPREQAAERTRKIRELTGYFDEARAYHLARAAGQITDDQIDPSWEAMAPFLSGTLPVIVHADDARQIGSVLDWAEATSTAGAPLHLVIAGGRDAWRMADRLAVAGIDVIYEHVFTIPDRDTDSFDTSYRAPGILAAAGVRSSFSLGAGSWTATTVRNLPHHAAQCVPYGLSPDDALRGVTLNPASTLGLGDRLGSIEPGKDATLIVTDGDILDIRSAVTRMWILGREVSLESRHTRLWDRYRARPRPSENPR